MEQYITFESKTIAVFIACLYIIGLYIWISRVPHDFREHKVPLVLLSGGLAVFIVMFILKVVMGEALSMNTFLLFITLNDTDRPFVGFSYFLILMGFTILVMVGVNIIRHFFVNGDGSK